MSPAWQKKSFSYSVLAHQVLSLCSHGVVRVRLEKSPVLSSKCFWDCWETPAFLGGVPWAPEALQDWVNSRAEAPGIDLNQGASVCVWA